MLHIKAAPQLRAECFEDGRSRPRRKNLRWDQSPQPVELATRIRTFVQYKLPELKARREDLQDAMPQKEKTLQESPRLLGACKLC